MRRQMVVMIYEKLNILISKMPIPNSRALT
jgi:hypothetical protein